MTQPFKVRLSLSERSPQKAQEAASALTRLGFDVEGISPRGVNFVATDEQFQSAFDCAVTRREESGEVTFAGKPKLPADAPAGSTLYIPTAPEYFPKSKGE